MNLLYFLWFLWDSQKWFMFWIRIEGIRRVANIFVLIERQNDINISEGYMSFIISIKEKEEIKLLYWEIEIEPILTKWKGLMSSATSRVTVWCIDGAHSEKSIRRFWTFHHMVISSSGRFEQWIHLRAKRKHARLKISPDT